MLTAVEAILWFLRFLFGACIFSFLNVVIDRMPRGERPQSLYELWKSFNGMGIDPMFQFPCTERQMQGMQKPDPGKGFLVRSDRGSSFLWLRFELWLRQFRDFIPEGCSDFCVFRNITCGGPD